MIKCPECKSGNLDFTDRQIQTNTVGRKTYRQEGYCRDCGFEWELERDQVDQFCKECGELLDGAR